MKVFRVFVSTKNIFTPFPTSEAKSYSYRVKTRWCCENCCFLNKGHLSLTFLLVSAEVYFTSLPTFHYSLSLSLSQSLRGREAPRRRAVPVAAMRTRPGTAYRASRAAPTARTTPPAWPRRTAPFGWPCCPSSVSACWSCSSAWSSSTTSAGTRCAALNCRRWLILTS